MHSLVRNKKGQFVIIIALLIAALTLAAVISIQGINIHSQSISYKPANEFLLGVTSDMNRALTFALSEYTDGVLNQGLTEGAAAAVGSQFMESWKQSMLTSYSSYGIESDLPQNMVPTFQHYWAINYTSFSSAYVPYAFDVNSYGFIGWTGEGTKYVTLQITSVTVQDWPTGPTTVEFQLMQSDINETVLIPIPDLPSNPDSTKFRIGAYNALTDTPTWWTKPITLTYLGDGNYRTILSDPVAGQAINPIHKGVRIELATPNDNIWIQNSFYIFKNARSTTTTLLSPASPITFGQPIKDSATVTGLGANFPIPTGQIQFQVSLDGGSTWSMVGTEKTLTQDPENWIATAVSDSYISPFAGNYKFKAVYLGDENYDGSESGNDAEPMTINKATPKVTTKLSATTITLGGSVTDEATVTNVGPDFSPPTGTISFQVKFGSGSWTTFSTAGLNPSGKATSEPYTPLAAGTYFFRAIYPGDVNYNPAQSGDTEEPLTVNKATPKVTTSLYPPATILGGSVTDTATVTGLSSPFPPPTGSVTFQVSADNFSTWDTISTNTLVSGSATSSLYTTNPASSVYYFRAVYLGDSNYVSAQSGDTDEPLTPGQPSIATILSSLTIQLGNPISDTAIVTGIAGFPTPTGTITFQCRKAPSGSWSSVSQVTLSAGVANMPAIYLTSAGDWYFRALYSGDANYTSAKTGDTAEPLTVTRADPTVTTTLSSPNIILGQSITDSATVLGLGGSFPVPTGLVTFKVSQDGGLTWTTFGSDKTLAGGSATSDSFTPKKAGTNIWYFKAFYQGDDNYNAASSGNTAEPLLVNKASTTTTTLLSKSRIYYGQSITDSATVTGLGTGFPAPTGNVTFQFSVDVGTTWITFGSIKTLTTGSVISDDYTPFSAGGFNFRAVYSGDDNYVSSSSDPAAEPLYVDMTPGTTGDLIISGNPSSGQDGFISNDPNSPLNPYDKVNPQLSNGHPSHTFSSNFLLPSIVTADTISIRFMVKCVGSTPYQTIKADLWFTYNGNPYSIGTVTFNAIPHNGNPPPAYYPTAMNVAGKTFVPGFPVKAIPAGSVLQLTLTLINPNNRVDLFGGTQGTTIDLF